MSCSLCGSSKLATCSGCGRTADWDKVDRLHAVAEAAQGVLNCVDGGDQVWTHTSLGACMDELDKALRALDRVTAKAHRVTRNKPKALKQSPNMTKQEEPPR